MSSLERQENVISAMMQNYSTFNLLQNQKGQSFSIQQSNETFKEPSLEPTFQEPVTTLQELPSLSTPIQTPRIIPQPLQETNFKILPQKLTPITKRLQILIIPPNPPKIQPRISPRQPNNVPKQLDFSMKENKSVNCITIKNSLALMAMLKKMRQERLTAGYIQHSCRIYWSKVFPTLNFEDKVHSKGVAADMWEKYGVELQVEEES